MLYLINKQGCCNVGDTEMTASGTTTMMPTSLSTSTQNSFNYMPNGNTSNNVGQCNTEAAALAAATCLQQLQIQFMQYSTNPLAMAAALSALSSGGGACGGGFPTNTPHLPQPNMNCPPVRFNSTNSDVNTNTPCSTSNSVAGMLPTNFDWSTSTTPFFPTALNSIDSNLPMIFPNESNFLLPNNNNNNSTPGQLLHPMDGYSMMMMTMNALKPNVITSLAGTAALPGRCDYYQPVDNCCVNTIGDTVGLVSESSDLPIDLSAKR
uniref:Uncharacterized protein n=1 Tax=Trichobilharzia regenti TaxID=157069 RepID=A0AA85J3B2_TRIRE|nr:unnamed protein product [Trichobilharzia regenti]